MHVGARTHTHTHTTHELSTLAFQSCQKAETVVNVTWCLELLKELVNLQAGVTQSPVKKLDDAENKEATDMKAVCGFYTMEGRC